MFKSLALRVVAGLLATVVVTAPARAQVDGWQFGGSVYMWFAGLHAKVQSGPASGSEVNVSFSEIFNSLSWAPPPIMLAAEARNGRFGIAMDLIYLDLEDNLSTKGILFSGGKAEFSSLEWTVEGFYRFYEDPTFKLDAGAGFRLWNMRTKLTLRPGVLDGRTAKVSETFVDPIVALRANIIFGNGWSITALGDVGGFGVSSDFTWQALGTLNYQITNWADLRVGWRHIGVNRSKMDFGLDGPIAGATFRF